MVPHSTDSLMKSGVKPIEYGSQEATKKEFVSRITRNYPSRNGSIPGKGFSCQVLISPATQKAISAQSLYGNFLYLSTNRGQFSRVAFPSTTSSAKVRQSGEPQIPHSFLGNSWSTLSTRFSLSMPLLIESREAFPGDG